MVTVAVETMVGVAVIAACTVTAAGLGTTDGAEYNPFASMKPACELPPATPFTDQVTPWVEEFCTVAVNCFVVWVITVADDGDTVTDGPGCLACPELESIIRDDTSTASNAEPL